MEATVVCSKAPRYDGLVATLFYKKNKIQYEPFTLTASDRGVSFCTFLIPANNIKKASVDFADGLGATIIDHGHKVSLFFERFKIITKDGQRHYFVVATQLPNSTDQKDSINRLNQIFKSYCK